ncbi:uncharacterized protein LOC126974337 [Leptidea sinapis]|uniref:uncharacterized protein LOC126974337 n=1 Tax=Leptidea sinapis TaxID=189913 RepID=UPI0021C2AE8F|nr:uncharacterized protein LOC126974337 [Leptidea sinapis]
MVRGRSDTVRLVTRLHEITTSSGKKRLSRNLDYKKLYTEFIREYINLGHMTRVNTYPNLHYFLPHHGVFREHSTTTKLRVVFDASAVTSTGKSFNDIQLVGPPIQGDLLVSIPRLELCRALLGAQLYKIRTSLTREFDDVIFWTDSTIVLGWLHMAPSLLKTFVQNRVAEINELTNSYTWRHVAGKENPVDLVSRGVSLKDLASLTFWWEGPTFLHNFDFHNNTQSNIHIPIQELPEVKPNNISLVTIAS